MSPRKVEMGGGGREELGGSSGGVRDGTVSSCLGRLHTAPLLLLLCYQGLAAGHVLLNEGIVFVGDCLGEFFPFLLGHVGEGHYEGGGDNYK